MSSHHHASTTVPAPGRRLVRFRAEWVSIDGARPRLRWTRLDQRSG
ncbi:MAG: hypothetical protein AAGA17_14665 [Actinomycetota bacterium]